MNLDDFLLQKLERGTSHVDVRAVWRVSLVVSGI
jgi:hypothetical protein